MVSYAGWKPSGVQVFRNNVLIGEFGSVNSCSLTYFPDKAHTYLHVLFGRQKDKCQYYSKKLNLLFVKIEKKGYLKPNNRSCASWCVFDKQQNKKYDVKSSKELGKLLKLTKRFYKDVDYFGFFEDDKYKIWRA